jgi:hypothetical protein
VLRRFLTLPEFSLLSSEAPLGAPVAHTIPTNRPLGQIKRPCACSVALPLYSIAPLDSSNSFHPRIATLLERSYAQTLRFMALTLLFIVLTLCSVTRHASTNSHAIANSVLLLCSHECAHCSALATLHSVGRHSRSAQYLPCSVATHASTNSRATANNSGSMSLILHERTGRE